MVQLPDDEQARLDALRATRSSTHRLNRVSTTWRGSPPDLCGTPMALVTFVDAERQWFKATVGLQRRRNPARACRSARTPSSGPTSLSCPTPHPTHASRTTRSSRAMPHVRFYAGAPLIAAGGHALGAICVIDRVPRQLTTSQETALTALGRQVVAQLELRRSTTSVVSAADRQRAEDLLRALTEGTASVTGERVLLLARPASGDGAARPARLRRRVPARRSRPVARALDGQRTPAELRIRPARARRA